MSPSRAANGPNESGWNGSPEPYVNMVVEISENARDWQE
jgi:hypothetical protein